MVLLCFIYRFKAIATSTKVLSFEILSANRPNRRENRKKTPSKKKNKQNWGVYIEKTQHGDLDIIIRQPSMFSFFPFFMMPVLGVFFDGFLNFFRISTISHIFHHFSARNCPQEMFLYFLECWNIDLYYKVSLSHQYYLK